MSRFVTHVRYRVEAFFGLLQNRFKYFASTARMVNIKWDADAYRICGALVNMFHVATGTGVNHPAALDRFKARKELPNLLKLLVEDIRPSLTHGRTTTPFQRIRLDQIEPIIRQRLTYEDLYMISCGPYQIANSRSYLGINRDENAALTPFKLEVYTRLIDYRGKYHIDVDTSNAVLVRGSVRSRYSKSKVRRTLVLFDRSKTGFQTVVEYYCTCQAGARTAGCCSHSMCVIWFLCHAYDTNPIPPLDGLEGRLGFR